MPEQQGLTEFFAMEAGEYLERLDTVVSKGSEPDREEFVRLTRALRGSALMANQQPFAAAAGALERLARAVHDRSRAWDAGAKQLAVRAVDDLKILVRKVKAWTEADTVKAQQIATALQQALGGAAPAPATKAGQTETRAFVAQQGAGLATVLEQAANALQQNPLAHTALQVVLKTMQPLRGIASLADHPPLPDLLDGIDRAIGELTSRKEMAPGGADFFRAAAKAVSRAAQDVASKGRADPEAPEARDFARRLGAMLGLGGDVVSIEALYFADQGPHVVTEGTPAARPAKLGSLELVSHGDHLRQAADAVERAESTVQRELRAHGLVGTFHSLATAGAGVVGAALAAFAQAARDAVAQGKAVSDPVGFARLIREAGTMLSAAAHESEAGLSQKLAAITQALRTGTPGRPAAPAPAPPPAAPRRPHAPSAEMPAPPAPRASPAPAARARPGAAPAAGAPEDGPGLVGSYRRLEQLVAALGMGPASLEELMAGPPVLGTGAASAAGAGDVVAIADLCYSGEAALARALSLREQVRAALAGNGPDGAALDALTQEIFDLVQLGSGQKR